MKRLIQRLPLLAMLFAAPLAAGCGNLQNDRCETICNCESCGDREAERCAIEVEADYAVAVAYDCVELLEPYWECQLDRYECDDGHYRDDGGECEADYEEYRQCLDALSTRRPGPYHD